MKKQFKLKTKNKDAAICSDKDDLLYWLNIEKQRTSARLSMYCTQKCVDYLKDILGDTSYVTKKSKMFCWYGHIVYILPQTKFSEWYDIDRTLFIKEELPEELPTDNQIEHIMYRPNLDDDTNILNTMRKLNEVINTINIIVNAIKS